jgi:hypothetical protein
VKPSLRAACGSLLFLGIVALQTGASATRESLYPLNAYRMFDRHWPDGIVMERVLYVDEHGRRHRPWDVVHVPFFQANHASYATFLDPASPEQRADLCRSVLAGRFRRLSIVAEEVEFVRSPSGAMTESVVRSEEKHVCTVEGSAP